MKRTVTVLLAAVMFISSFSFKAAAGKYPDVFEINGVMQTGDFDSLTDGFIVYFPAELMQSGKRYPVAVWANGTMCAPVLYTQLLSGVARAGYVVIACPDMMPKDGKSLSAAVDYITGENGNENSIFYNRVDTGRIGAFGHSQGGAACVNASADDVRIRAVVSIAGASTGDEAAELKVPTLFLTGKKDYVVLTSAWVKPSYKACTAPAAFASLKNGIHTSCMFKPGTYVNYTVKWFDAWLYENGDKASFIYGGELSKDPGWTDFEAKNFDCAREKTFFENLRDMFLPVFENVKYRLGF